jgi:hypothetical protein
MKFKYTTQFTSAGLKVSQLFPNESFSKASLDNLKSLIPNSEIDFDENIDLLGVAFNAAVVNKFNKNDDGINAETAFKINKLFKHKPTNIEHKKEKVVGHILTTGFSEYGSNRLISQEELFDYSQAFNISLGAVVYKFVNKEFASALEKSADPDSDLYNKISTSWELGFNEYNIAVGSDNINEAEIITDEKQIKELKGKLKSYGGSGKLDDGTRIYRLVVGEIFPLGIGFTATPAADVKGVAVNSNDSVEVFEKPNAKIFNFKSHYFVKNNSQLENIDVNCEKERSMNLENLISEVKEALIEKKISQEAAANMTATFTEAIKKKDEEYRNELASAKNAAETAEKERAEIKASMEEVQKQLAEALQKINEFETSQKAAEALAAFNSRMEEIDSMFELDDQDRQILVDDIKSITDDESFANYKNKLSVIWRNKNKELKTEQEKEIQAKINAEVEKRISSLQTSAAQSKSVEDILDSAKASNFNLPNNNQSSSKPAESLMQRFAEAFKKENILIS